MVATPKRVTAQAVGESREAWPYAAFLPGFEREKLTPTHWQTALSAPGSAVLM